MKKEKRTKITKKYNINNKEDILDADEKPKQII